MNAYKLLLFNYCIPFCVFLPFIIFNPKLGIIGFTLIATYIMVDYRNLKKALLQLDREQLHLSFLTSCRDYGVIPKFLQTRSHFISRYQAKKKYDFELNCLKRCIRAKHALIASISNKIYGSKNDGLYHKFSTFAVRGVFDYSMMVINTFRDEQHVRINDVHNKKLEKLTNGLSSATQNCSVGFVNYSDHTFSDEQIRFLNKGPKYVHHSTVQPVDYIPQLEEVVRKVEPQHRNNLRCAMFLEYNKHVKKQNELAKRDRSMINSIRNIPSLIFIPTDKSSKIAALNKADFLCKMDEAINSLDCSVVTSDPLQSILNKTSRIVKEFKKTEWDENIRKSAKVNTLGIIPKMVSVVKDHKPNLPLRPIVVKCQAPTFFLEKTLVLILKDILPISAHSLLSTTDFIHKLDTLQLPTTFTMYSLDVVALYPSVDMNQATQYINTQISSVPTLSPHMRSTIISALNLITSTNYFRFNNKIYFQSSGAPMGSPLSALAAECIMRPLEESFLSSYPVQPLCWYRYVDDVFVVWTGTQAEFSDFLTSLNNFNQKIKFTMEEEKDGNLPYLDVLLQKKDGHISRTVHRKSMNSNCTIPYEADISISYKRASFRSYVNRAFTVCTQDTINQELDKIRSIAIQNNFPLAFINNIIAWVSQKFQHPPPQNNQDNSTRVPIKYVRGLHERLANMLKTYGIQLVARSGNKLMNLLKSHIDPTPISQRPGVYEIPILLPDNTITFYIGQTSRKLEIRLKEHSNDIARGKRNSAIARAFFNNPLLQVQFNNAKIVAPFTNQAKTIIRESIEIYRRNDETVNDQDSCTIPSIWLSLL